VKRWLALALITLSCALGAAWLSLRLETPGEALQLPPPAAGPMHAPTAPEAKPVAPSNADFQVTAKPATTQPEAAQPEPIRLNAAEAVTLMQLMAEQGDPRSPALQTSQPRTKPSAAALADPTLYSQFEAQQTREQIQAYTAGTQQIPQIRERIEQAAQSGERNAEELNEARAALEQLEMLQSKLQRESPELLPNHP